MNIKKILAAATAAVLAVGVFTVLPESPAAITVSAEDSYETDDGFYIDTDENGVKYVSGYWGNSKKITIPKEAEYIEAYALQGTYMMTEIESVTIGANIKKIEAGAFKGCKKLKTVKFSSGSKLETIGNDAFLCCTSLTSINLPDSLKEIGSDAFANCAKLTSLTVPAKTKIDVNSHFAGYSIGEPSNNIKYNFDYHLADGKTEMFYYYVTKGENEIAFTQKPITLYVTKGSDAEKYAKKNGIAYKYGSAPKSTSTTTKTTAKKLAAPTGIKATKSDDKLVLTWSKVSGAEAYRVYKYNEKTGKYVKYKDVTGTKCTVTGLKGGTTYKFKIYSLDKQSGKYVQQTASKEVSFTTKQTNTDYITL